MGRSIITKKYEITPEIKELQKLAVNAQKSSGCEVNVDITQDLVTINGFRKMNRVEAKSYLLDLLDPNNPNKKITTSTVRNVELEEKLAKEAAKKAKKQRKPGQPPALKALIRRAKRIHKKAMLKGLDNNDALAKAYSYVDRKGTEETLEPAKLQLSEYFAKEQA